MPQYLFDLKILMDSVFTGLEPNIKHLTQLSQVSNYPSEFEFEHFFGGGKYCLTFKKKHFYIKELHVSQFWDLGKFASLTTSNIYSLSQSIIEYILTLENFLNDELSLIQTVVYKLFRISENCLFRGIKSCQLRLNFFSSSLKSYTICIICRKSPATPDLLYLDLLDIHFEYLFQNISLEKLAQKNETKHQKCP